VDIRSPLPSGSTQQAATVFDPRIVWVYILAIAVVGVLYVIYGIASRWQVSKLYVGKDGALSTSKFQWFLWTVFVIWGYAAIYFARVLLRGDFSLPNVTPNILVAIGFSGATAAVAKGVTTGYLATGRIRKASGSAAAPAAIQPQGGLFAGDDGTPDLSKVQLLAWTFIAIGVFIVNIWYNIPLRLPQLPDIDASLLVLMGLGQAAYIGTKLTSTTVPRLTGLSVDIPAAPAPPHIHITVSGQAFGASQSGGQITFDGAPILAQIVNWGDTQIVFDFPTPAGKTGITVQVGVIAGGQVSSNNLPYTYS
jgi:hypothetical protein